ncbi:neuroguidin isoform X2 [Phalacrocorax carbo]|uniref:neuroguidin isoform X2 n=1 Tax=Phalacrocorax carbo TaxID=9209 RepID=UPI00311A5E88
MAPVAEAVALLEALRGQVAAVAEHGRGLLRRVRAGGLRTGKGVSLLEVRAQALLQYLQDLGLLLGGKARGGALGAEPALPRLLETRVVLEKLRPIEQRLKYQLEKLLRVAAAGGRAHSDPLRFRPDPANMAAQEEEQEEEEEESGHGPKAPGLGGGRRYVPPRLVPVQYGAEGQEEREQRARAASRRRALSASVLRELREELSDAPQELWGGPTAGALPAPHSALRRTRYEEAMLVRLSESRRGAGVAAAGGGRGRGPGPHHPLRGHRAPAGARQSGGAAPQEEEEEGGAEEEGREEEGFPPATLSPAHGRGPAPCAIGPSAAPHWSSSGIINEGAGLSLSVIKALAQPSYKPTQTPPPCSWEPIALHKGGEAKSCSQWRCD